MMKTYLNVKTAHGTILSVSFDVPEIHDENSFSKLDFLVVHEVTDVSDIHSREFEVEIVMGKLIKTGNFDRKHLLGNIEMADEPRCEGQKLLKRGLKSQTPQSFKIEFNNGDCEYFQAYILSFKRKVSCPDTMVSRTLHICTLDDPIEVPVDMGTVDAKIRRMF